MNLCDNPKILLPRFDTHGDHVLLSGLLSALLDKFPQAKVTLLVREGYDQLAPLLPSAIRWLTTTVMPYGPYRSSYETELLGLLNSVASEKYDLLLTTIYNRTWLDELVAASLCGTYRIAIGEPLEIPEDVVSIAISAGLDLAKPYEQLIEVDEWVHETVKYQRMWDVLFPNDRSKLPDPRLEVPLKLRTESIESMAAFNLTPGKFFVCAPAGTQNVSIKNWPTERFAEVISWIEREYSLKPLLIGHEREMYLLEEVASLVRKYGGTTQIWTGTDGNFAMMAAIIQQAKLYCGNDTGPLHVAAAVGTPVVGIYGGGTWPRFIASGTNSISIAGEMDCFGCYWNCEYLDGRCMKLVEVADVQKAVKTVIQGNSHNLDGIMRVRKQSETNADRIRKSWLVRTIKKVVRKVVRTEH